MMDVFNSSTKSHLLGGVRPLWLTALLWFGLVYAPNAMSVDGAVAVDDSATSAEHTGEGLDPDNLPAEMSLSLEQLLNDPEGIAPDVEANRCLGRSSGYSTEILDTKHLLFKSPVGNRAWLNRLASECIGLRSDMVLVFEPTGSRLCNFDTVYGASSSSFLGVQSARCRLGMFEPITKEHAQSLEETFKLRGKALAESRRQERRDARAQRKLKRRQKRAARKMQRETPEK